MNTMNDSNSNNFRFVDSTSELSNNTQATAEFNNVLYVLDGAKYFAIAIGNFLSINNKKQEECGVVAHERLTEFLKFACF